MTQRTDPSEEPAGNGAKSEPESRGPAIPDKSYFRIGEVARIVGVKPYVLRYWESEFRQIRPQKSKSQQRLYRRRDVEVLLAIKELLHKERYTIAGARKRLRELGLKEAVEETVGTAETAQAERTEEPERETGTAESGEGGAAMSERLRARLKSGLEEILKLVEE